MSAATSAPAFLPDGDPRRTPELDPEVERQLADRRERIRRGPLVRSDRAVTYALAAGFLVASLTFLAVSSSTRHPSPFVVLLYISLYALLSHVNFEIDAHGAVPVQLVLVPMLFTLPLAWVPLCVAAGYLVRDPVGLVTGKMTLYKASLRLVSSWHALGPAIVLYLAGEGPPEWSKGPIYVLALLTEFAIDFGIGRIREHGLGVKRPVLRGSYLIYGVDIALAPIGLLVAFADVGHRDLVLLVLPLVGLLQVFAREREQRLDAALELGHAYRGTAMLLGDVVEADDAYTGEHSRDVVSLTLAVAEHLGLTPRERRNAEFVALLHDVGKIGIPPEIINKPGPLDPRRARRDRDAHAPGRSDADEGRRPPRRDRPARPLVPRTLGRSRVSGRVERRRDSADRTHRLLHRRLQRDDDEPSVSLRDDDAAGLRRARTLRRDALRPARRRRARRRRRLDGYSAAGAGELLAEPRPLDVLADPRRGHELVAVDEHVAAKQDDARASRRPRCPRRGCSRRASGGLPRRS